jgi:WD40 repeat protein
LATGSDDMTARLWDLASGETCAIIDGHCGLVEAVAFHPDGKTLATGSQDGTIKLWDTATGEELAVLHAHADAVWSVAFSPDGATLVAGSEGAFQVWSAGTIPSRSPAETSVS